ncbi:S49 family peptidase [Adhaeribacter pallidiroseus]|nr:S49 family peptidase [Adhaeribacter pallidiroseus]
MIELLEQSVWAIDPRYVAQHESIISKMFSSGSADVAALEKAKSMRPTMQVAVIGAGEIGCSILSFEAAAGRSAASQEQRVAVIPLVGPVMKNGNMCAYGSKDVIAWVEQANADASISAMVLLVDSPGGAVDGTEALGAAISASAKPIVGYVDGLAASAAYWAISQTSEIFISSRTTAWAGSIGTLIKHMDISKNLEAQGVKVTYITADRSTDKVKGNSTEPLSEEAIADFKADLNSINDTFISTVKAGRGAKITSEEVFTAKVYNGKDAIKLGLVDKVGSLQDAVSRAAKLAKTPAQSQNSNNSQKSDMLKFPKLASLLGLAPSAAVEGTEVDATTEAVVDQVTADADLTDVQAQAAESALAALETERDAALDKVAGLEATIATLTGEKTALTTDKADLQAKLTTLEQWKANAAKPGAKAEDTLTNPVADAAPKAPWELEADKYKAELAQK